MIQHVTREVGVAELGACIAFYEELGFSRVPAPPALAERYVWLQLGPTQVHLALTPGPVVQSGHIAVVLDSYEATVARLRNAGHTVEPRAEHWGAPRAYVHDPAGNLVEVMAWPPEARSHR
jgi:catechol 2,3-dioxygenase-like lactoylglutathione lyase family enzyme